MSGFSELGAALGGAQQGQANAYQTGILRGAQGADLLEQARERRNKNLAMSSITPAKIAAAQADPSGPAASELGAALVQAGENPEQMANYEKVMQGTGWGNQAMTVATSPNADLNLLNRINMVRDGKPAALSGVQGNTLLSTMVTPDQQAAVGGNVPTAVGQSDITAALARAGASNASAARQYAGIGADKAGNYDVVTDGNGNMVRVNKLDPSAAMPITLPGGVPLVGKVGTAGASAGKVQPSVLDAVLGKASTTGKPNPQQALFQVYMADHPELTEAQALQAFSRASQNVPTGNFGTPGNSLPVNPGNGISAPPVPDSIAAALNSAATSAPAAPGQVNASGDYTPPTKTVVRTGTQNGRKVVQYSDGTIDYAD